MADTHLHGWRGRCRNQAAIERPVANLLLRLLEVPDNGRNAATLCRSENLRVLNRNLVTLHRVEVLVRKVGRFADALAVQQAEPAMEWRWRWTGFLEEIAVGPVAHSLQQALAGLELAENVRRADVRVVHQIAWGVARAPFGEVEGQVGKLRFLDLLADPAHVADDSVGRWGQLGVFLAILVQESAVNTVRVGGNEVHPNAALGHVIEEFRHPGG